MGVTNTPTVNSGPFALLWSGGKDSCLALWRARNAGLNVTCLVTFFDDESRRVRFHATRTEMIRQQAAAVGLEVMQLPTNPTTYAATVRSALDELKSRSFVGIVSGDIHLAHVRADNEKNAARSGLSLIEPLWHYDGIALLEELVSAGFRAVLTSCDEQWADVLWPGREIDRDFIEAVAKAPIDPCGENGEYHSFVFDGPLFAERVPWSPGEIRRSNGFSQLDLIPN